MRKKLVGSALLMSFLSLVIGLGAASAQPVPPTGYNSPLNLLSPQAAADGAASDKRGA